MPGNLLCSLGTAPELEEDSSEIEFDDEEEERGFFEEFLDWLEERWDDFWDDDDTELLFGDSDEVDCDDS